MLNRDFSNLTVALYWKRSMQEVFKSTTSNCMQRRSLVIKLTAISVSSALISCTQISTKANVLERPLSDSGESSRATATTAAGSSAQVAPKAPVLRSIDLDYQRYDAAAPVLPSAYSAKHYDVLQLLKRLVAIASGPRLSRADIEREFGIRFVQTTASGAYEGVARGRYPLGSSLSRYYDNSGGEMGMSFVSLSLVGYAADTADRRGDERSIDACVRVGDLYKALGQSGWQRVEPSKGSHHALRIIYRRAAEGRLRQIEPDPPSQSGNDCMRSFYVSDSIELAQKSINK